MSQLIKVVMAAALAVGLTACGERAPKQPEVATTTTTTTQEVQKPASDASDVATESNTEAAAADAQTQE